MWIKENFNFYDLIIYHFSRSVWLHLLNDTMYASVTVNVKLSSLFDLECHSLKCAIVLLQPADVALL